MKSNRPPHAGGRPGPDLNNRKILLGVCGGIAAYKSVELARLLIKAGARVQVVMTHAAEKFVTPLTFETITGRHVFVDMFPPHGDFSPWHTEMASWPDLAVIAPATANHMARLACGIADDLLTTIMLTLDRPRLLCPSMNHRMWANAATQDNLGTLKRRGYRVVMPEEGDMARPGEDPGMGRLADPDAIFREISHILSAPQDLRGVRVLVTAGRTEESWDPVRVLTNRASGRMGFALAEEAHERGAEVVLVHGPTDVIPPGGIRIRRVTTASEMASAVKQEFPQCKIVLMSAAVADYTFARTAEHKIKKGEPEPQVQLVATEDILRNLSDRKGDRIIVGFALETENLLENALRKLREKHMDIVVANNPLAPGSGFAGETNQVLIIHRSGRVQELPLQSKREAARDILNAVISIFRNPEPEPEPMPVAADDSDEYRAALDFDDDFEMPAPAIASHSHIDADEPEAETHHEAPQPHQPAPTQGQPQGQPQAGHGPSRSSRRNKRRKQRHKEMQIAQQQGAAPAGAHADGVESEPAHVEPAAPKPVAPRAAAPVAERKPVEVKTEPETAPAADAVAELPFPGGTPAPAKKSGRTRRGGRRNSKSRTHRQDGTVEGAAEASTDVVEAPPPPPPPPARVPEAAPAPAAASEPAADGPAEKKAPAKRGRKPAVKKTPKKTATKTKPAE